MKMANHPRVIDVKMQHFTMWVFQLTGLGHVLSLSVKSTTIAKRCQPGPETETSTGVPEVWGEPPWSMTPPFTHSKTREKSGLA
jgi:hypothetical protein